jgi:hypothetical protein
MLVAFRLHVVVALVGFFALGVCAQLSTSFAQPNVTQTVAQLIARQANSGGDGGNGRNGNNDSSR